jgi:hypothetical protein
MASTIIFYADYLKAGVGTTPSAAPTITVYAVNRATGAETLVGSAGASMTASALAGRYYFRVTSADLSTSDYHARAHTSDTSVDQQDVPALWVRWSEADSSTIQTNLDATVSSRSTYAGGPVASVSGSVGSIAGITFPANFGSLVVNASDGGVTVHTNSDKTGYTLASAGLDTIVVETGVNARQALSPILAACAGVLAGAPAGPITIKGGNVTTTRITADVDGSGNRTGVTLNLPA